MLALFSRIENMFENFKNKVKFINIPSTGEVLPETNPTEFISSSFKVCKTFSSFLYYIFFIPYKCCVDEKSGKVYFNRKNRIHTVRK